MGFFVDQSDYKILTFLFLPCAFSAPENSVLQSSRLTRDADVQTLDDSADEEIKEDFTYLAMGQSSFSSIKTLRL